MQFINTSLSFFFPADTDCTEAASCLESKRCRHRCISVCTRRGLCYRSYCRTRYMFKQTPSLSNASL